MIWLSRLLDKSVPISRYAEGAENWKTCAGGEFATKLGMTPQFHLLDADDDDCPRDKYLRRWGNRFYTAVHANDRKAAFQLYRQMFNYIARDEESKNG